MSSARYKVEIDHLQEEAIEAGSPQEAARAVAALIGERETLRALPDDEPVQIKRPDRRPWGRNLTMGDFRHGDIGAEAAGEDGPVRSAGIVGSHGITPSTKG